MTTRTHTITGASEGCVVFYLTILLLVILPVALLASPAIADEVNGQLNEAERAFLARTMADRQQKGLVSDLARLLIGQARDQQRRLEDVVETSSQYDPAQRLQAMSFLVEYLECRGEGKRTSDAATRTRRGTSPSHVAVFLLTNMIELDSLLLQQGVQRKSWPPVAATQRVLQLRRLIARLLMVVEGGEGRTELASLTQVLPICTAVGKRLETLAASLPEPRLTKSLPVQPLTSSSGAVNTVQPIPPARKGSPTSTAKNIAVQQSPTKTVFDGFARHPVALPLVLFFPILLSILWMVRQAREVDDGQGLTRFDPLMAGELALQRKNYRVAAEEFRAVLEEQPEYANAARLRLCIALAHLERRTDVSRELKRLKTASAGISMMAKLAAALLSLGMKDEARTLYEVIVSRGKASEEIKTQLRILSGQAAIDPFDVTSVRVYFAPRYLEFRSVRRGTSSVVYRAYDSESDREVALKIFAPDGPLGIEARTCFESEMSRLKSIDIPQIVPILDFGLAKIPYYAMAFVEGEPLDLLIASRALRQQYRRIVTLAKAQALALAGLHGQDLLHRDFRPSHVIVEAGDSIKVIGLGGHALKGTVASEAPVMRGSPAYMAPEVLRGKPCSRQSDIYSFGITCYEMVATMLQSDGSVSGTYPFGKPRQLSTLAQDCPQELDDVIMQCIEFEPTARPAHCEHIVERLAALEGELS